MSAVEERRRSWALPDVLGVEAAHVRLAEPGTRYAHGQRRTVSDVVELSVRTSGPIPVRALGVALYVGETAVLDYVQAGENRYRFVAYEPDRLREGAEISIGWSQLPRKRVRTSHRFHLGRGAPLPVASLDEAAPVAAGRLEVPHVPLLRGHHATPPELVLRWNAMSDIPSGVDVVIHLHGYCLEHAAPAPPGYCLAGHFNDMTLPRDREPFSGLDFSNPDDPHDPTPGRVRPTLGVLPRGKSERVNRRDDAFTFPALDTPHGLLDLRDAALAEFAHATGAAHVGALRLILTAHSGGGAWLERILGHGVEPDEIHLFDATYGSIDNVAAWAHRQIRRDSSSAGSTSPGALRVLYRPGTGTEEHALALQRELDGALAVAPAALLDRYAVEETRVAHMAIPAHFGWRLLADAGAALPDVAPAGVDVTESARANDRLAHSLHWDARLSEIAHVLGVSAGSAGDAALVPAVVRFQRVHQLAPHDGILGRSTWAVLKPLLPAPQQTHAEDVETIHFTPAEEKALRITNAFENTGAWQQAHDLDYGGLAGDFDGQGLSFGLLQWNIGTGSLQTLLRTLDHDASSTFDSAFGPDAAAVRAMLAASPAVQLAWARSLNDAANRVIEPWAGRFRQLAAAPAFRRIQLRSARPKLETAARHARELGLTGERGLALMFDSATQHGDGWLDTRRCHGCETQTRRQRIVARGATTQADLLRAIAEVRAETTAPHWQEDVRRRALTIVDGHGTVHGHRFDLGAEFGLGDAPATPTTREDVAFAEDVPVLDPTLAVPPFRIAHPVAPLTPTDSAATVAWNQRAHPGRSGVDPALIRAQLGAYVDLAAVQAAVHTAGIAPGSGAIDAVFVEAVHQFQAACFADSRLVDGKAGASTLDSLGLVRRVGMTSAEDNPQVHEFLAHNADEIRRLTGGEFSAAHWYDAFVNPAFLGWTFQNSVHPILVRKLRRAETALLALPAYSGLTPRELAAALHITERHKGGRPSEAHGPHTVGLAVDVNYDIDPYIKDAIFNEVMTNAARLISGSARGLRGADLHALRTRPTAEISAELHRRSRELVDYFRLIDPHTAAVARQRALRELLDARHSTPQVWREGETPDAAAQRWEHTIAHDLDRLSHADTFSPHDPRKGFVGLATDLVVALRDTACLAWGAVDFGPDASGDVMHFDCRTEGVGRTLIGGFHGWLPEDGIPCVVAARSAHRQQRAEAVDLAENATDPLRPARPPVVIAASVGHRGRNAPADVGAVQDALLALRYLTPADHAREHPATGSAGPLAESRLAATVAAIGSLQADVLGAGHRDGRIDPGGATLAALNRAIPRPTPTELAAIAAQLASITETVTRGVAATAPVGRVSNAAVAAGTANLPAEVGHVQQRLVELGYLRAGHGETPPPGGPAPTAARLPRTIAALTAFQGRDVDRWVAAGEVTGPVTPGMLAPGDATQTLLNRIANYREVFASGEDIAFRDFIATFATVTPDGVDFTGIAPATALPAVDYANAGASPAERSALIAVSANEGNFDGFNSWDIAVVTLGFVQFAGGARSLRPFLARLKSRRPAEFSTLLTSFGIDMEFNVSGGRSHHETPVVIDPSSGTVVRGDAAEQAIRTSKKLSAVLIRAGRNVEVQRIQVESALRQFMIPGRAVAVSYEADVVEELAAPGGAVMATHVGRDARTFRTTAQYTTLHGVGRIRESRPVTTSTVGTRVRSERGIALILDRAVNEGPTTGPRRVEAALRWVADDRGLADIAAVDAHEQRVLARFLDDFDADLEIQNRLEAAQVAIDRALHAVGAPGATVAAVLASPDVPAARTELDAAVAAVPRKVDLPRARAFNPTRSTLEADLPLARAALDFTTPPATPADLRDALRAARGHVSAHRLSANRRSELRAFRRRANSIVNSATLAGPPPPPP